MQQLDPKQAPSLGLMLDAGTKYKNYFEEFSRQESIGILALPFPSH